MYNGLSYSGHNFGSELTTDDNWQKGIGIGVDVASLALMAKGANAKGAPAAAETGTLVETSVAPEATTTTVASHPTFQPGPFAGRSIPARSSSQVFTPAERAAINDIGNESGCHTCGTTDPGTKSSNFVPDHQPVSSLNTDNAPQNLYPHCLGCSKEQGLAAAREVQRQAREGN